MYAYFLNMFLEDVMGEKRKFTNIKCPKDSSFDSSFEYQTHIVNVATCSI